VVSQEAHLAGQALGGLEYGYLGRRLGAQKPRGMVADHDPLAQRLVGCHAEPATELDLPDEQEAETILGIHLVVGEQAQIFEDIGA
jgi:hypothetical protein